MLYSFLLFYIFWGPIFLLWGPIFLLWGPISKLPINSYCIVECEHNRPPGAEYRELNIYFRFFLEFYFGPFWGAALVPSDSPSNSMHFALLDASVARFLNFC